MEARIVRQETSYVNSGALGVYVDHGNGAVSRYLSLSEIFVAPGQMVTKRQAIGILGRHFHEI
ncbi:M23 family metallopeptidase [Bacillus cytotoxicus]|nr:M23 family metallopeptidase [Bacillus cytotoxicus]MDH2880084.1 M23 family metallopeptidase [Bacillus cytotoxicus]